MRISCACEEANSNVPLEDLKAECLFAFEHDGAAADHGGRALIVPLYAWKASSGARVYATRPDV